MNNTFVLIFIAAMGGIAVAIQGQFMGLMDKGMGTKESVLITYGLGAIAMVIVVLLSPSPLNFKNIGASIPWYVLSSGLLGLVIVSSISYSIPRLGLATAFTIVIAAQFIVTALIEQFGWFGAELQTMSLARAFGFLAIIGGVWLVAKH
ncbi:MAG: DMT family transporter [Cocleimonas sp.]